jgi:hypothetical protein
MIKPNAEREIGLFLIHSGFDLQSSRRYVQYFEQPFCDHVPNIYKVNYFSNSCTLFVVVI